MKMLRTDISLYSSWGYDPGWRPKCYPLFIIVHIFKTIGLWSKVVHYIGNKGPTWNTDPVFLLSFIQSTSQSEFRKTQFYSDIDIYIFVLSVRSARLEVFQQAPVVGRKTCQIIDKRSSLLWNELGTNQGRRRGNNPVLLSPMQSRRQYNKKLNWSHLFFPPPSCQVNVQFGSWKDFYFEHLF